MLLRTPRVVTYVKYGERSGLQEETKAGIYVALAVKWCSQIAKNPDSE
jgi:hypothetical protein